MANIESTDATELIDPESLTTDDDASPLPTMRPMLRGGSGVSPLPRRRAPSSSGLLAQPEAGPTPLTTIAPPAPRGRKTLPPPRTATLPSLPRATSALPVPMTVAEPIGLAATAPIGTPPAAIPALAPQPIATSAPVAVRLDSLPAAWSPAGARHAPEELGETDVTHRVRREAPKPDLRKKLMLPVGGVVVVGIAIGAYFALRGGHDTKPTTATTPIATTPIAATAPSITAPVTETRAAAAIATATTPTPVPAPTPAPVTITPVPAPAPAGVQVRFESSPPGANVLLVDRGETSPLGTTPLDRALDPSRTYYAVFTSVDQPPRVAMIDPRASQHVAIDLRAAEAPAPAAHVATPAHVATATTPTTTVTATTPVHPAASTPAPAPVHPAATTGVLMVSTKPPTAITIDGKATGLMTPQKAIKLSAGTHKVALFDAQDHITRSFTVEIAAAKPIKLVIPDMTKR